MDGEFAFTNYVAASARNGRPVDGPELEALWIQLRGVLAKELRRRGLWAHSPKLLGIHGTASWAENDGEALEELTSDCFSAAVLHRLPTYEVHLQAKPNVEGLVFRAITNFLYDTQKRHDPLGFRVYLFVHAGVRRALAEGRLALRSGPETVTNESVLAFSSRAPTTTGMAETVLSEWSRQTAPTFAAALLKAGELGRRKLAQSFVERLGGLEDAFRQEAQHQEARRQEARHQESQSREASDGGAGEFSFKSLVDCWKLECRNLWSSMLDESGDGPTLESPLPAPGHDFEAREAHRALRRCVQDGIEGGGESETARDRLHRLFRAFESRAEESTISDRGLEKLLGIPRRQVAKLRARLEELATFCSKRARAGTRR